MSPTAANKAKQIFVAYSYKTYAKADYRKIYLELEKLYDVRFIFADEKITNMHIMQKIISYIRSSDFSIFDISGWNPNVTLELGFAMATGDSWYIMLNPAQTEVNEVPSDLRGLDRIQYDSFDDLGKRLGVLIEQQYPRRREGTIDSYLDEQRRQLLEQLSQADGLTIQEIAGPARGRGTRRSARHPAPHGDQASNDRQPQGHALLS